MDIIVINRLEKNHVLRGFDNFMSQMSMLSFKFFTTEKKGVLLIGHGHLYGTLRYIVINFASDQVWSLQTHCYSYQLFDLFTVGLNYSMVGTQCKN